jgi:hypothetical protein
VQDDVLAEKIRHFEGGYFERRRFVHREGIYYIETLRPVLESELSWWQDHFNA